MIVAKRKPFDEIMQLLKGHRKILVVGCGTCVAVCLAGGEKEVAVLTAELEMARRLAENPVELGSATLERQCDREYLAQLDGKVEAYDALISMACGVGIQFWPSGSRTNRSTRRWTRPGWRSTRMWAGTRSAAAPAAAACWG
jgi:ferredoxin